MVKEKLKLLKEDVKLWNKEVPGNLDKKIEFNKEDIKWMDLIDDALRLDDSEDLDRKCNSAELFLNLKMRNMLASQKARNKWLLEEDVNSSYSTRLSTK